MRFFGHRRASNGNIESICLDCCAVVGNFKTEDEMLDGERSHSCQSDSLAATLSTDTKTPILCPICWDQSIERIQGIVLSARPIGGQDLSQVSLYRCRQQHLFALFEQPAGWA
jgi:hypothetical protein